MIRSFLKFGDIVLIRFPYSDLGSFKRRPAMVINDFDDGDVIVCRITSKIYYSFCDVEVKKWEVAGLKLPSTIRVHKIATLDKGMVEMVLGRLDNSTIRRVRILFRRLADNRKEKPI